MNPFDDSISFLRFQSESERRLSLLGVSEFHFSWLHVNDLVGRAKLHNTIEA